MNTRTMLLTSVAALMLSAPAFSADKQSYEAKTKIEKDSDGNYSEKTKAEKTDVEGTTTSSEKNVSVDVDSNGAVDKTIKTETTTDPKGLMNKQTTKTKDTTKVNADGSVDAAHKKVVNGKTVESTTESH